MKISFDVNEPNQCANYNKKLQLATKFESEMSPF